MNRIDQTFAQLKEKKETALIPFMTVGDPTLDVSIKLIQAFEEAGANMIELGVPYSDPLADGPVIQRASERALAHDVSILDVIQLAGRARQSGVQMPFILFTYYNPVLQVGFDEFFKLIAENDISGLIIPDLPIEEDDELRAHASTHNIHLIPLVAPTSEQRVKTIAAKGSGFIYCVSSLGVTGERAQFATGLNAFLETVKTSSNLPIAIGFGVSTPEHVRTFSAVCDGVVVGSAIVRTIEEALPLLKNEATVKQGVAQVQAFVRQLKQA
jgi:tryptophan synthase alpha chain